MVAGDWPPQDLSLQFLPQPGCSLSPHAQKSKGFCSLGWTTVCGPAVEAEAKLRFPVLLWSLDKWLALTWGHCQVWLPHEPALPYRLSSLPGEGCRRIFLNCGFPDIFRQQNSCFRLKSYLKPSTYKRIKAVLIEAQTLSSSAMASLAIPLNKVWKTTIPLAERRQDVCLQLFLLTLTGKAHMSHVSF